MSVRSLFQPPSNNENGYNSEAQEALDKERQLSLTDWQVTRPGVKVCRERVTNILTVTDITEMGLDVAADFAIEKATDGTDSIWIGSDIDCIDASNI